MDSDEKSRILTRYTQGTATPEEKEMVERWFETLQLPAQEWAQMPADAQQVLLKDLYSDIQNVIHQDNQVVPMPARNPWWRPLAAAAAVLIFVMTAWLLWPVKQATPPLAQLEAPAGHLRFLKLPDGSSVWVNAGSRLQYPARFSGKTREVYLTGEAYFDVQHQTEHPFIIHTGNVSTTVLGTAFNIRENPATHLVTVTVKRGKVSVAKDRRQLAVLLPDQQLTVPQQAAGPVPQKVKATQAAAWLGSDLQFDNVAFADAAKQLEDHFGVPIRFSSESLKNYRFSGTAAADEPLDEVLKVMCAFNHAAFHRQADGSILITN